MIWRAALVLLAATSVGCASPCDRELRVTERRCGHELAPAHNTGEQTCESYERHDAKCALKHKDDYCEWLDAIADGEDVENDYVRCLLQ